MSGVQAASTSLHLVRASVAFLRGDTVVRVNGLLREDMGTLVGLLFRCMHKLPPGCTEVATRYLSILIRRLTYAYIWYHWHIFF